MLNMMSAYRTVSTLTTAVLTGVFPIKLLLMEQLCIHSDQKEGLSAKEIIAMSADLSLLFGGIC